MYVEGNAKIKYHKKAFLNPKARYLRDLSVALVGCTLGNKATLLDATSGTGIRGIRYCLEAGVKNVKFLDINRDAYNATKRNVSFNGLKADVINKSIQEYSCECDVRFDAIDIDPFGGIYPYVYDTMKISKDNSCMMLTSTDAAVLCGAHESACIRLYGSKPMHNELCHEVGLRIMANYASRVAAQFNFGIEVMLSVFYAHYMRIFIRLKHGSSNAMESIKNTGYAYYCGKCGSRGYEKAFMPTVQSYAVCDSCGAKAMLVSGSMWLGNLYNKKITSIMLSYFKKNGFDNRETGELSVLNDEFDTPFFYSVPKMTRLIGVKSVSPAVLIEKLLEVGYKATRTHLDHDGIKTDANAKTITGLIRNAV